MKRVFAVLFSIGVAAGANAQANPKAIIHTSDGDITVELYADKAPKTVENFVGLSTGQKTWTDPRSREVINGRPLYNGVIFHRTIPGFMIQGGDPSGSGAGNVGFQFADEFSDLKFDQPYLLAMANKGPNTNSSQFFITVAPTPHLNNKHTIFGKVVAGMDIVDKIINKPANREGRANEPTVIKNIEIQGAGAPPAAATSPAAGATSPTQN